MSQDFQKVLVKDDRLMVTDSVKYAVIKGGSNMTCAQYAAISQTPSSVTFNIQVPSQETVISRNALIRTTMTFSITGTPLANAADLPFVDYGTQDAFGPFPFHQMVNSTQWTINNNTVSQNTREILPVLTRIHDKRWLARYNGMTPTMFDTYGNYNDGVGALNNVLGDWQSATSLDNDLIPRGCFPIKITGSNVIPANSVAQQTVLVTITVTEPVLLSPWTFAGDDSCGMYGVQNLNAIYNLTSAGNTAFRMANTDTRFAAPPVVTLTELISTNLLLQYLTPHPSDLMPSRNCLPYYELPRYLTSNLPEFVAAVGMYVTETPDGVMSAGPQLVGAYTGALPLAPQYTLVSQSLQLNQIPDKIYITCNLPPGAQSKTCASTDSFLAIQKISINWNNSSGLLSSATTQDLWRMSVENGINQSWQEFQGFTAGPVNKVAYGAGASAVPVGAQTYIQTCGSVLCLEFGKDIELKDDYYAPGSLGNFQLQFNLTVANYNPYDIAAGVYNIQTIIQNSGVFSLERGVASSYLGILTKSDVLEASRDKPYAYSDAIRMVGGAAGASSGFFKRLMGTLGRVAPKLLPVLKEGVSDFMAHKGAGMSGGGSSGGGMSGGRRKKGMGALDDRLY